MTPLRPGAARGAARRRDGRRDRREQAVVETSASGAGAPGDIPARRRDGRRDHREKTIVATTASGAGAPSAAIAVLGVGRSRAHHEAKTQPSRVSEHSNREVRLAG